MIRRSKLNKTSKKPVSKIKKQCDKLVKEIAKVRDKGICQKCEKFVTGSNCHGSHVIPVSAGNKLAFDPLNLKTLCYHCHMNWWHKNPMEASDWFKTKFPERWEYLNSNRGIIQMRYEDFVELKARLEKIREELKEFGLPE